MREWSYSLTTNTIWFDKDYGRVEAEDYHKARELAVNKLTEDVAEINRRLDGFATLSINVDEVSIEEIESPK